jgi:cysteine-rich repeat protein
MSIRLPLIALCAAATVAACSFDAVNFSLSNTPPDGQPVENCATPGDEDGNGLADCDDAACAGAASCQVSCGNGKLEAGEACDDGNTTDGDACEGDCTLPRCGNSIIDTSLGELCDPPATGTCSADCRSLLACGNGEVDPGEECDDGLANNGDNKDCRSDCVINRCGDGRVNTSGTHREDCDGAPLTPDHVRTAVPTETATCNSDCTAPRCGDGKVNSHFKPAGAVATEQCDNGVANSDSADCTASCQVSVCGDNHLNSVGPLHKEGCDDGNRVDTDNCTNACIARSCGDGIVGSGEECDLGAANSDTGACLLNCRLATCGDDRVRAGVEECDGTPGCSATCHLQRCGNGIVEPGELCDDGNTLACGSCSVDCQTVSSSPATGAIFAAPGNAYVAGDSFVLSDGIAGSVIFEFTNGTPAAGHIAIRFTASDSPQTVAAAIASAVQASGRKLTVQAVNGVVLLQHQRPTSKGNIAIIEAVATGGFAVFGMTGGKGGDCPASTGCADDDDCASHVCASGRCQ